MSKTISTLNEGLDVVTEYLHELFLVIDKNYKSDFKSGKSTSFKNLVDRLIADWDHHHMDDILGRVYLSYLFVIKGIRNEIEHPEIVELESKNIIGNTLDTMRIFLEGIVKIINSYRRGVNTILPPRFEYSINQPDDNEAKIIPTQKIKSKSRDYITIQKAPFSIEGMDIQLTKENISEIFSQFPYFKKGEKILAVKTFGDIFTINKDLTGYTGDWQVNEEVDKVMVLHFYDGPESTTAAVYVGNYVSREERTEYRVEEVGKERHRYSFKDLLFCGEVYCNHAMKFGSFKVFSIQ